MNPSKMKKEELLAKCAELGLDVDPESTWRELVEVVRASGMETEEEDVPPLDREELLAKAQALNIVFPVDPRFVTDEGLLEMLDDQAERAMEAAATGQVSLSADAINALNALGDKLLSEKEKRDGGNGLPSGFVTDGEIRSAPRVHVLIPASSEPGGELPVKVSVNGYACVIPRDVQCEIPRPILQALLDAKNTRFEQVGKPDPETGSLTFREIRSLRFPVLTGDAAHSFVRQNPREESEYVSRVA
jgi:hypothetical protein